MCLPQLTYGHQRTTLGPGLLHTLCLKQLTMPPHKPSHLLWKLLGISCPCLPSHFRHMRTIGRTLPHLAFQWHLNLDPCICASNVLYANQSPRLHFFSLWKERQLKKNRKKWQIIHRRSYWKIENFKSGANRVIFKCLIYMIYVHGEKRFKDEGNKGIVLFRGENLRKCMTSRQFQEMNKEVLWINRSRCLGEAGTHRKKTLE